MIATPQALGAAKRIGFEAVEVSLGAWEGRSIGSRPPLDDAAMTAEYRDLSRYYSLLFPLNDRQREFFARLRSAAPVESVLDVGGGTGEHLAWFSGQGVRGYGLEPDAAMFRELRRRQWPGPAPVLAQAGVEALPASVAEKVDLVLCLGNTLAHIMDQEALTQLFKGVRAVLLPAAPLIIQVLNYERLGRR